MAAVALLLSCRPDEFLSPPPSVSLPDHTGPSKCIVDETFTLEATSVDDDELKYFAFQVDLDKMHDPRVVGWFTACGGAKNDVEVHILNEIDFINWKNLHKVKGLYRSGRLSVAKVDLPIPATGTYHLVFDNRFSVVSHKNISARFYLYWFD